MEKKLHSFPITLCDSLPCYCTFDLWPPASTLPAAADFPFHFDPTLLLVILFHPFWLWIVIGVLWLLGFLRVLFFMGTTLYLSCNSRCLWLRLLLSRQVWSCAALTWSNIQRHLPLWAPIFKLLWCYEYVWISSMRWSIRASSEIAITQLVVERVSIVSALGSLFDDIVHGFWPMVSLLFTPILRDMEWWEILSKGNKNNISI